MSRISDDGAEITFGGDGHVDSVNGESVEHGMSGTTCWDSEGNARDDYGPSGNTNGDLKD